MDGFIVNGLCIKKPFASLSAAAVTMVAAEAKETILEKQTTWGEGCIRKTKRICQQARILMDTMIHVLQDFWASRIQSEVADSCK